MGVTLVIKQEGWTEIALGRDGVLAEGHLGERGWDVERGGEVGGEGRGHQHRGMSVGRSWRHRPEVRKSEVDPPNALRGASPPRHRVPHNPHLRNRR